MKINNIYLYFKIFFGILIITLLILFYFKYKNSNKKYLDVINNQKALLNENKILKDESYVLRLSIDQMRYFQDSILVKMDSLKNILKIKDKNLKQLYYIKSNSNRIDTLILRDTVFRDNIKIDTIIQDQWYKLNLSLIHPNSIIVNPSFKSEKTIITSITKETINPPSKWWIVRLFQKKHKILKVDVIEENPYIQVNDSKFIEIIK